MNASWKKRLLLCGASALLLFFAFPPFALWPLGFVALVPFHFAVRGVSAGRAAALGFFFGFAFHITILRWLVDIPVVTFAHAGLLCAIFSVYPAALAAIWSRLADRPSAPLWLGIVAMAIDWGRGHAGMVACPWLTIAQTQHNNLSLLQWASVGGEALVGCWVVGFNVAIAQWISRIPSLRAGSIASIIVVAMAHAVGGSLARSLAGRTAHVAVVQPDTTTIANADEAFVRLNEQTRRAAERQPDLIVWPESAAGDVDTDTLALFRVRAIVEAANVPLVFGSSTSSRSAPGHNSMYFMQPDTPMGPPYRKVHLFPYAEYTPDGLASRIGPRLFQTIPGDVRRTFHLGDIVIEPLICFESMFADDVRATASAAPSVITIGVNDSWFGKTGAAELHNMVTPFRAVENRRPVAVASNGGPSQIVDADGRIVARAKAYVPDIIDADVHVAEPARLYRQWGDKSAFALFGVALAIERLLALVARSVRVRTPRQR